MQQSLWLAQGASFLRDFYAAQDAQQVKKAVQDIAQHFALPLAEDDTTWLSIDYAYNALFVGPKAPLCPPYASVYLGESTLMGKHALDIRAFYALLGYELREQNRVPDDHVAFIFDASLVLFNLPESPPYTTWKKTFVHDYLVKWLPSFCVSIQKQENIEPAFLLVAHATQTWLEGAAAYVTAQSIE